MKDTLLEASNNLKSSLTSLKRKIATAKTSIVTVEAEIERLELKVEKVLLEADNYKNRIIREANKEIEVLKEEISSKTKEIQSATFARLIEDRNDDIDPILIKRASTVAVIESIVSNIASRSDDFVLISYAFLFPAVYEQLPTSVCDSVFLDKVPESATIVINKGRQFLKSLRDVCETHLTNEQPWELLVNEVADWWKNEALPLLYGKRNSMWDYAKLHTREEMLKWKASPYDRILEFPEVYDAFTNYQELKEKVFAPSGVKDLEVKFFSYQS